MERLKKNKKKKNSDSHRHYDDNQCTVDQHASMISVHRSTGKYYLPSLPTIQGAGLKC